MKLVMLFTVKIPTYNRVVFVSIFPGILIVHGSISIWLFFLHDKSHVLVCFATWLKVGVADILFSFPKLITIYIYMLQNPIHLIDISHCLIINILLTGHFFFNFYKWIKRVNFLYHSYLVLIKHNLKQGTFRGAFGSTETDFTGNRFRNSIVSGTHLV